ILAMRLYYGLLSTKSRIKYGVPGIPEVARRYPFPSCIRSYTVQDSGQGDVLKNYFRKEDK
ncbi:MAG: hypothetical protein WA126_00710, partial [Thermodesulfovibrionales bacterium]